MCWKCGKEILLEEPISRGSECSICHSDLHCCKNCIYYSLGSHYDCHETIDEIIVDKEKSNFCDSFKVKRNFLTDENERIKKEKAKKALDSLFGV